MTSPRASLLVRHRWAPHVVDGAMTCTPYGVSMYRAYDPVCPGCRTVIRYGEIGYPHRYRYDARAWRRRMPVALIESIGLRLDLRAAERQVEAHRRAS